MFVRPRFLKSPSGSGTSLPVHSSYAAGNIHLPFNWVAADNAAKAAIVPIAGDLYKALWQVDTNIEYILTSISPIVWTAVGGGASVTFDKVRLVKTTAQSIVAPNANKILFNVATYDTNTLADLPNSKLVIKRAGYYQCDWRYSLDNGNGTRTFSMLYKNGAEVSRGHDSTGAGSTAPLSSNGSDIVNFAVNDVVELYAFTLITHNLEPTSATTFLSIVGPFP